MYTRRRNPPPSRRRLPMPVDLSTVPHRQESRKSSVPARRSTAMLEMMFVSLFTILPDYLYRRFVQGKRFGKEITLYSVWYELRWGITSCVILTILLITTIFYNHPSTSNVTLFFRTVPVISEANGRVAEVFLPISGDVKQGAPIFRLDSSKQEAAVETARKKIAEV